MNPLPKSLSDAVGALDPLPLSLLNDYLYCPRRAALKLVEGWREANVHTERGTLAHDHADLPGYEVVKGVKLLRALPVWSERLGLLGKCDIVEVEPETALAARAPEGASPSASVQSVSLPAASRAEKLIAWPRVSGGTPDTARETRALPREMIKTLRPVEYKISKRRQWDNDDAQLCAQALCLEEMFGVSVPRGAIFHADSKRRREVEFTTQLRASTERAVADIQGLLRQSEIPNLKSEIPKLPAAVWKPACEECSLYEICLPKATGGEGQAERLARQLFQI